MGSHVPQCTRNLLRLSRDTAARLDRLKHRCSIREHPGKSAAQNNIVKNSKTTEDYEYQKDNEVVGVVGTRGGFYHHVNANIPFPELVQAVYDL